MKKNIFGITMLSVLFVASMHATDRKLAFIDANLDDFINRVIVPEDEQKQFKIYYANLAQKIHEAKEKEPKKERATYRYLYNLALENLKTKHADWYEELSPFVSNPVFTLDEQLEEVRKVIRFFLTRYGAYEEFLNYRAAHEQQNAATQVAQNESGLWNSVTSFFSSAASKVAGLFGFGKEAEKTA